MRQAKCDRLFVIFFVLVAACGGGTSEPAASGDLREIARGIMRSSEFCALVTVDADGQPRARTVHPFAPEDDLVVWLATRPVTRKVEQIRSNPKVTLYYFDPDRLEYVSIMGRARLVDDLGEKTSRRAFLSDALYPNWPDDCLLIEVTPDLMEVQAQGVAPDVDTWRPQSVEFSRD